MENRLKKVPLRQDRLSDQVKHHLKAAILKGEFAQGDKLPTEEQIAANFQVSKVTAREALREMESQGLIEKRRGSTGEASWRNRVPKKWGKRSSISIVSVG